VLLFDMIFGRINIGLIMSSSIREVDNCPICLETFILRNPAFPVCHRQVDQYAMDRTIHNVSHCFHANCLVAFCNNKAKDACLCPLCMRKIEKVSFAFDDISYLLADVQNGDFQRINALLRCSELPADERAKVLCFLVDRMVVRDVNRLFQSSSVSQLILGRALNFAIDLRMSPRVMATLLQHGPITEDVRGEAFCRALIMRDTGIALQLYHSGPITDYRRSEAVRLAKKFGYTEFPDLLGGSCVIL
jgi:hypothetical protein